MPFIRCRSEFKVKGYVPLTNQPQSFWKQELEKDWYWLFQHLSTTSFSLAGVSFASLFGVLVFLGEPEPSSSVLSLLLICGALFAVAGEMAREAYMVWKFLLAEITYMSALILLGISFLILVSIRSTVLSDPQVVSVFLVLMIIFFSWRIVHNVHVAQRHVGGLSKSEESEEGLSTKGKLERYNERLFRVLIWLIFVIPIAAAVTNLRGEDMSRIGATLATITGILLGLRGLAKEEIQLSVVGLLLGSIMASILVTIFSVDPFYSHWQIKGLFVLASLMFTLSAHAFVKSMKLK